jgi:NADH-quinone oxidoreductase subunit D
MSVDQDRDQPDVVTAQTAVDEAIVDGPVERPYLQFVAATDEGEQQLKPRSEVTAKELMRELGSVLRMSEAEAAELGDLPDDPDEDQTMIINMGPQHPSTHGVLRLMLELRGEEVLRCKPIIGYLHTGMEKTGEQLTYTQGGTNVTRMDYLAPLANELAFAMATEKLLGIDGDLPDRAVWIRMLMVELNRMSSHLLFMATNGMDLGAVSMMIYGWREREEVLRFFQTVTGLRMNHNYIRPGGVAADLPPGWRDGVLRLLDLIPPRLYEYDTLMTGQPIWRERLQGVGVITPTEALALGATGPILRSTGVEWDLRRDEPYMRYDEMEFDVIVGSYGDAFDRYAIRLAEIRESIRIVHQILDRMPQGDYRIQDRKITPPPRARIDESMEALIHHFKIFTEGFKVPEGEVYVAVEGPRGELGCYIVSDGGPNPYRMHMRDPSFVNIQCLPHMMRGGLVADAVAIISSVDPVLGGVDR